jgi:4-amino-4-deoxy-L-arabinose transferase-like glycosyltransferase
MAPRQTIMLVLKRSSPASSQHGVIPDSLRPEGGVLDPSSTFLQWLWKASRANLAWLALALLLLPFGIYKLRDLALPYFWDELGVYARAAVYLHDHALGLLPSYLPPELSRGHPLLLAFVFGALFRVFGATPLVAHVGMLLISTGLVVSVFWIAREHWNAAVGLAAAGLLLAQPLFLAQSTLLLPEIPLALACLWAMHAFSRKKFLQSGLFIGMAIFLKETAVVLTAALAVILIVQWLRARPSLKSSLDGILALAIPGLLYGIFLLVQKHQNGWYLYPFHENQVNFHWSAMKGTLVDCISTVFVEQGRLALSVIVALWIFFRLLGQRQNERRFVSSLAWSFAVFGIGILVFSAGNVFMKRYLLCLLPPLTILSSRALFELVRDQTKVLVPATIGLGLLCLGDLTSPRFNCAYDMSFRQSVLLQQEATQYLENTVGPDKAILANFPTVFGLEDPRYGYTPEKFNRSSYRYSPEAEYIFASEIYDHFTPPAGVHTELMRRFSSPYMNIALYRILR